MRKLFIILSVFFISSCDRSSEVEKEVNAEFKKLQAKWWEIQSLQVDGDIPDSLHIDSFNAGRIRLNNCEYEDKGAINKWCAGQFVINDQEFIIIYRYDFEKKIYQVDFSDNINSDPQQIDFLKKLRPLFTGKWAFTVTGDMLTARQEENEANLNIELSFSATN